MKRFEIYENCFRPLTGISLFLSFILYTVAYALAFSSPHGDFSFSMAIRWKNYTKALTVFVPSRGFLFFYITCRFRCFKFRNKFSSPHGDFSFSIKMEIHFTIATIRFSSPHGDFSFSISTFALLPSFFIFVFVPSRGFLFFYMIFGTLENGSTVFVPSRGFLFFYYRDGIELISTNPFSSPHGDFSFSIISKVLSIPAFNCFRPLTGISLFLYRRSECRRIRKNCFRPLTGISLFLFYLA